MKTIDTEASYPYSPLVAVLKAFYTSPAGEQLEVQTFDASLFADLKAFLVEEEVGFREIYDGPCMTLQFVVPQRVG
ncbi:MAG: sulfurtransferase TusA family protein [Bacteroidaceae bacterium]